MFVNIPSQVTKVSMCIVRLCIHQLPVSHAPPCYHGNCPLFHPHLLETSNMYISLPTKYTLSSHLWPLILHLCYAPMFCAIVHMHAVK